MENAITEAQEQIAEQVDSGEGRGRLLSPEEWALATVPFSAIKIDFKDWTDIEYDIALKYASHIATGWFYFANKRFVFEKTEDYMLFKLWADERPMHDRDISLG